MTRLSVKPRDLEGPDFTNDELLTLVEAGIHVPDHSRLAPWRFNLVLSEDQAAFNQRLADRMLERDPNTPEKSLAAWRDEKIVPLVIVVGAKLTHDHHKVPVWEQLQSCGAACMNIMNAAHALGLGGQWLSSWPCEDDVVKSWFGLEPSDAIVGIIYLGRPTATPAERERVRADDVATIWRG